MEDISLPQPDAPGKPAPTAYCVHCNVAPAIPGFATNLCADCRHNFNHYPIPKWIWFFAAVVAVLMIGGLIRMPSYIQAVAHLKRAERAIKEHRYNTARNEAKLVLRQSPDLMEAHVYWFVGSAYMLAQPDLKNSYEWLEGRSTEDTALSNMVNAAIHYVDNVAVADSVSSHR